MKLHHSLIPFVVAISLAAPLSAQAVHWSPGAGGNGHWYEAVSSGAISWTGADSQASALYGGHLATMSDLAENNFCFDLVNSPGFWSINVFGCQIGPWIGYFQLPGSSEPAGGWTWVDGTTSAITNWYPGEPNNSGGTEHVAHFFNCGLGGGGTGSYWNDVTDSIVVDVFGFVVEYEFAMGSIVPGAAGGPNGLFAEWGTPGNTVYFLASLQLGSTNVPGCGGLTLGISHPAVLGTGITNASGGASKTIIISANMAGRTAHFQAADRSGCRVTQVVSEVL